MYQMVMYVSKNLEQAGNILDLWAEAGVRGVTILPSAGLNRTPKRGIQSGVGVLPSLASLLRSREIQHRTVFSVVKDPAEVRRLVDITTDYIGGDWSLSNVGLLIVLPVNEVYGIEEEVDRGDTPNN